MADNLDIDVSGNTDYRKLLALQLMQPQPAARSFGEGLLQGVRGAAGAGMLMYQGQQDEEKRKKLADAISASGGDIEALKTTAPELYGKVKLQQALNGAEPETFGTSPTWGLQPGSTEPKPFLSGSRGSQKWLDAGKPAPDVTASPNLHTIKRGDQEITVEYDPRSRTYREISAAPRDLNPPMTDEYVPGTGETRRALDKPGVVRPPRVGEGTQIELDENGKPVSITTGKLPGGQSAELAGRRQFAKDAAGNFAKDQSELHKRYDAALTAKETIGELLAVIGDREVGKFTSLTNTAKAYANSLGADFDETKIGDLQQAEQMANTFALNALKSMGGNDTEFEYKKQLEFSPGPDNTRRRLDLANKSIELQSMQVAAEAKEMARIAGLIEKGADISFSEAQQHMRDFRRAAGSEKVKLFRDYAESARKQK